MLTLLVRIPRNGEDVGLRIRSVGEFSSKGPAESAMELVLSHDPGAEVWIVPALTLDEFLEGE
jgi:hypothetical protein